MRANNCLCAPRVKQALVLKRGNAGKVIRRKVQEIPVNHRVTQGVKLIEPAPEEKLVGVARTTSVAEGKDDGNGDDDADGAVENNGIVEE